MNEDVRSVERHLRRNGWEVECSRVDSAEALHEALQMPWDVVLCDDALPELGALEALHTVQTSDQPDLPFLVIAEKLGEEAAIELLQNGASDVIHKQNLARLSPALDRQLADAQVRREKRETQRALTEALASREELIAVAGHELRNPLAALQITIDSLQRTGRAPEHARALRRQAARLRDLVTRFVDIAALDAGTFDLRTCELDLAALATNEARRITSDPERIRIDAPDPVRLHADRGRLELVVASLLDNALKFGGPGPVTLRVRSDGSGGLLEVGDRGPGLDLEQRESIFQAFAKRGSPHCGGFGLSLWLGRAILDRHGGSLEALPNPGGGTLFRMRLEAHPVSCSAPESSPAGPPPPPAWG
jgi:signal transduction histidine kinase